MNDFIRIMVFFIPVFIIGHITLYCIYPGMKFDCKAFSLLYGLGIGFMSVEMFFISLAGYKFSLYTILIPWALLSIIIGYWKRQSIRANLKVKNLSASLKNNIKSFNLIFIAFFLLISAFPLSRIMIGSPFFGWDAWAHWGLKAKIFYIERCIPFDIYKEPYSIVPVREYPLLVSLGETCFYNFLGRFDDVMVKSVFFMFSLCLLLYFYCLIKDIYTKNHAYLFTFFLATIPMFTEFASGYYSGYADLIFTYFNFISVTLLWAWTNKGQKELFFLSSVFAGFSFWTKVDGIVLLMANLICILVFSFSGNRNKYLRFKPALMYLIAPILIAGPWHLITRIMNFPSIHVRVNHDLFSTLLDMKRLLVLSTRYLSESLNFSEWNIFLLVFIILLIFYFRKLYRGPMRFIFINLLLQFSLYSFFLFIDIEFYRAIWNSLSRLLLPLIPLVLTLIAGIMHRDS